MTGQDGYSEELDDVQALGEIPDSTVLKKHADLYYQMALCAARKRDITQAAAYAHYCCELFSDHERAAKLLEICLCELGDLNIRRQGGEGREEASIRDMCTEIRGLAQSGKWRKAAHRAAAESVQNVRMLNIQGCIHACAGHFGTSARYFSKALEKDRGNHLALKGLMEATSRKKGWERLYDRLLQKIGS